MTPITTSLSLLLALIKPTVQPAANAPHVQPGATQAPILLGAPGKPKLEKSELKDGGFDNIDEGVFVGFTPQGRRYELWEVQKDVHMDHVEVLAFGPDGSELWREDLTWPSGESWSRLLTAGFDGEQNLYVFYYTNGDHHWRLVKVSSAGAVEWAKTLYTTSWDPEPAFIQPHPAGGIVLHSASNGAVRDLYTARIAADGTVLWEHEFDVAGANQYPGGLAVAADGSVYAVGHDTLSPQDGKSAVRIRKYAADGSVLWTRAMEAATQYEHPIARHVFLDSKGDLVVAGSTYAGGNDQDWIFAVKYKPSGTRARRLAHRIGNTPKLVDYGLQGVTATHAPDDSIFIAWDFDQHLDTKWSVAMLRIPGEDPPRRQAGRAEQGAVQPAQPVVTEVPRVLWTKTFEAEAAMSVQMLRWFPQGALGVFGEGKRKLDANGNDYRSSTRMRALLPDGSDLGGAGFESTGEFHNELDAVAIDAGGTAFVLGWQWWNGDGWNDEDVMRLRFTARK